MYSKRMTKILEMKKAIHQWQARYAVVVLAAGQGSRFGENKLFAEVDGMPLYRNILRELEDFDEIPKVMVTDYKDIAEEAVARGWLTEENGKPELGISRSVQLGLRACIERFPHLQGVLFSVCDQPRIKSSTFQKLLDTAKENPGCIICASNGGQRAHPVVWDMAYANELLQISGDSGGRQIMEHYPEKIVLVEVEKEELKDIDNKEDLKAF